MNIWAFADHHPFVTLFAVVMMAATVETIVIRITAAISARKANR